jgi:hypothetical protein
VLDSRRRDTMRARGSEGVSRTGDVFSGQAKQRSGWLIPLAVFFVTASLSALVLAYYFAPPTGLTEELPVPTDSTNTVAGSVGTAAFHIPSNYIVLSSARRGGPQKELAMATIPPGFEGYTLASAQEFTANAVDSRVVNFTLKSEGLALPEPERLARVYLPPQDASATTGASPTAARGTPGPYGLRQYPLRTDSGYRDMDLFVGATDSGVLILLCDKPGPDTPSPNCLRDTRLNEKLGLSYRFKRTHLADWKSIDSGLRALIARFTDAK